MGYNFFELFLLLLLFFPHFFPSQQGCAYGPRPIVMLYDGEHLDVQEVEMASAAPLHYLLVDLQGVKSTTVILQGLQEGFPVALVGSCDIAISFFSLCACACACA